MIDSILVNILLCQFSNCSLIKVVLTLTEDMPGQGLKLKKSSGRLLATNWRNIVAWCKFLVASSYNVNDAAQGLRYLAQSRSCEIQVHVNLRNSQKHAKYHEIQ